MPAGRILKLRTPNERKGLRSSSNVQILSQGPASAAFITTKQNSAMQPLELPSKELASEHQASTEGQLNDVPVSDVALWPLRLNNAVKRNLYSKRPWLFLSLGPPRSQGESQRLSHGHVSKYLLESRVEVTLALNFDRSIMIKCRNATMLDSLLNDIQKWKLPWMSTSSNYPQARALAPGTDTGHCKWYLTLRKYHESDKLYRTLQQTLYLFFSIEGELDLKNANGDGRTQPYMVDVASSLHSRTWLSKLLAVPKISQTGHLRVYDADACRVCPTKKVAKNTTPRPPHTTVKIESEPTAAENLADGHGSHLPVNVHHPHSSEHTSGPAREAVPLRFSESLDLPRYEPTPLIEESRNPNTVRHGRVPVADRFLSGVPGSSSYLQQRTVNMAPAVSYGSASRFSDLERGLPAVRNEVSDLGLRSLDRQEAFMGIPLDTHHWVYPVLKWTCLESLSFVEFLSQLIEANGEGAVRVATPASLVAFFNDFINVQFPESTYEKKLRAMTQVRLSRWKMIRANSNIDWSLAH